MANQHDAKIRFEATRWRAEAPDGLVAQVADRLWTSGDAKWLIVDRRTGFIADEGISKNPQAARAASRRAIARILKKRGIET